MPKTLAPWSLDTLSAERRAALFSSADQLERAAASADGLPQLLRGKRLALLTDDHASPAAAAFLQAATELGAHVALVRAGGVPEASGRNRAVLLGQLYDAIECQGLSDAELRRLGREAGVPVFGDLGAAGMALERLAAQMPQPAGGATARSAQLRHRLLQAMLYTALS
jgi:ornithine carbamoyltransferase